MNFLVAFILFACSIINIKAKFSNTVEYPNIQLNTDEYILTDKIFKFELTFEEGLSMSINQKRDGEFDPVDFNLTDGKFYVRDKNLFHMCHLNTVVTNEEELDSIITVDGRHRSMIFVNGQFPGPPIVVPKGSQVEITVNNHFRAQILSIHWHGQTQNKSFQMDGVTGITQCPIAPGEHFTYKFTASDVGTHWYHSHSSVQRTDGAIGPFIVFEKPTYDEPRNNSISSKNVTLNIDIKTYEKEFYFFVQDWQHLTSDETVNLPIWGNTKFWNGFEQNDECFFPIRIQDASMMMMKPDSFIINGKGWHYLPDQINKLGSFINESKKLPLEKFTVKPNKKYLFRVIGANMAFPIVISVNGHKINLVATDGNPIKPLNDLDYVIINGGERYDFELVTKNESTKNFFIIVQALASFDYNFLPLKTDHYGVAILKYENTNNLVYIERQCSSLSPCLTSNCPYLPEKDSKTKCIDLTEMQSIDKHISEFDKKNLFKTNYASNEFEEHFFNFHFSGENILRSSVNGKQYSLPRMPPFFPQTFEESIKGKECPNKCIDDNTCHCSSKTQITPGKVIQFVVYNMGKGAGVQGTAHPIHLHGHHVYVVSMGYPEYHENGTFLKNNKYLNCKQDDSEFCNSIDWSSSAHKNGNVPNANLINPVKKDTIIVPVGGYAVIRFYSDNIGYWFFHCHVEVHATEGMATLIQEGTHEQIRKNVDWNDMHTCYKGFTKPYNAGFLLKSNIFILIGIFFTIFLF